MRTTLGTLIVIVVLASPGCVRPSQSVGSVRISGCVKLGVEGGCRIIESFDGKSRYVLVGDSLKVGTAYEVIGQVEPGASLCMQGELLKPSKATPLQTPCPTD